MTLTTTLHRLSYLKWIFLIAQVAMTLYVFIVLPSNLITLIGTIIFITGIQMGLDSLSDIERMTDKQIERYARPSFIQAQSRFLLTAILITSLISLLFMSLTLFSNARTEDLYNQFFSLGLDCLALLLGFLCVLKSTNDKNIYALSMVTKEI